MLSFRQTGMAVWMYSALVVASALVLNFRYKPVSDGSAYLDTWTGKIHQVEPDLREPMALDLSMSFPTPTAPEAVTRIVIPGSDSCSGLRFAFPAPGTAEK